MDVRLRHLVDFNYLLKIHIDSSQGAGSSWQNCLFSWWCFYHRGFVTPRTWGSLWKSSQNIQILESSLLRLVTVGVHGEVSEAEDCITKMEIWGPIGNFQWIISDGLQIRCCKFFWSVYMHAKYSFFLKLLGPSLYCSNSVSFLYILSSKMK